MFKHDLSDLKIHEALHKGIYRGVVEDINDPLSSGRVRVRIWGIHSQNEEKNLTDGIPTNELPWAEPCIPTVEGGVSKKGFFGVPQLNSHVLVIFENGNPLRPIYIGSLPGGNGDWNTGGGAVGKVIVLNTDAGYIKLDSSNGATQVELNHNSGSKILMKDNGDVETNIQNDGNVTITGDANITVSGNVNLTSSGTITIKGSQVLIN